MSRRGIHSWVYRALGYLVLAASVFLLVMLIATTMGLSLFVPVTSLNPVNVAWRITFAVIYSASALLVIATTASPGRTLRASTLGDEHPWSTLFARCCDTLGVERDISEVRVCAGSAISIREERSRRERRVIASLGVEAAVSLDDEDLRFLFLHELAHVRLGHTWAAAVRAGLSETVFSLRWILSRHRSVAPWPFRSEGLWLVTPLAALPFLPVLAAFTSVAWLLDVVFHQDRRQQEFDADRGAAEHTGPEPAAIALVRYHAVLSDHVADSVAAEFAVCRSLWWAASPKVEPLAVEPLVAASRPGLYPSLGERLKNLGASVAGTLPWPGPRAPASVGSCVPLGDGLGLELPPVGGARILTLGTQPTLTRWAFIPAAGFLVLVLMTVTPISMPLGARVPFPTHPALVALAATIILLLSSAVAGQYLLRPRSLGMLRFCDDGGVQYSNSGVGSINRAAWSDFDARDALKEGSASAAQFSFPPTAIYGGRLSSHDARLLAHLLIENASRTTPRVPPMQSPPPADAAVEREATAVQTVVEMDAFTPNGGDEARANSLEWLDSLSRDAPMALNEVAWDRLLEYIPARDGLLSMAARQVAWRTIQHDVDGASALLQAEHESVAARCIGVLAASLSRLTECSRRIGDGDIPEAKALAHQISVMLHVCAYASDQPLTCGVRRRAKAALRELGLDRAPGLRPACGEGFRALIGCLFVPLHWVLVFGGSLLMLKALGALVFGGDVSPEQGSSLAIGVIVVPLAAVSRSAAKSYARTFRAVVGTLWALAGVAFVLPGVVMLFSAEAGLAAALAAFGVVLLGFGWYVWSGPRFERAELEQMLRRAA